MALTTTRYLTELDRVMGEEGRRNDWLADQVGVDPSAVTFWRQGKRTPRDATKRKIAAALGRSIEALFFAPTCPVDTVHSTEESHG